jgi:hypothetical protein
MSTFSFCLDKLRRRAPAAGDADPAKSGSRSGLCDGPHQREPPISLSELMAASAFLDFGGTLDERWLFRRDSETDSTRVAGNNVCRRPLLPDWSTKKTEK